MYITQKFTVAFRCWDNVNLFEHMKEFNTHLQGNGILAHEMYSTLSRNIIKHFLKLENTALKITSIEKCTKMISALDDEFTLRFEAQSALQQELINLQCDSTLKEKFQSKSIEKFCVTQ
ncbi:hypothetical protein RF11_11906 [Thelohanellus kitauei]|uniref:Uncharacterized protein n=1 Tax=Thelohanellus kitauei TaxID=669202 RepID=A0A0C2NFD3_THEKT|nr:hypothetical protein RF11_11906 [Thelohanellus kitauei]